MGPAQQVDESLVDHAYPPVAHWTRDHPIRGPFLSMLTKLPLEIDCLIRIVGALQQRLALISWWLLIGPLTHIPRELCKPGLE